MDLLLHVSMCEVCDVNELSAQKQPSKYIITVWVCWKTADTFGIFLLLQLKSHNVYDEPGKQYFFCFSFTELRNSEDFYTCLASVRKKRNSCTSQSCKENRRALKEINQNIEFLSNYSINVNKKTNKCSFRLQLKIVL